MLNTYILFLEEITKWIDKGLPVDIIYLDFQKVFDKVTHQRLLLKLKAHGIRDGIIDWIERFLEISFEWGTTGISIRSFIILNIYQ